MYGSNMASITVSGAVSKGDALGVSSGEFARALATVSSVVQMRCVAAKDGIDGETIDAYFGPTIISGARFSGATAGGAVYVAEGTSNGKYTQTAPSTTGDANTIVGYALSPTIFVLIPNFNTDTVA